MNVLEIAHEATNRGLVALNSSPRAMFYAAFAVLVVVGPFCFERCMRLVTKGNNGVMSSEPAVGLGIGIAIFKMVGGLLLLGSVGILAYGRGGMVAVALSMVTLGAVALIMAIMRALGIGNGSGDCGSSDGNGFFDIGCSDGGSCDGGGGD